MKTLCLLCSFFALLLHPTLLRGDDAAFQFEEVMLDAEAAAKTCYAVINADVNGDGRDDVVVVTDNRVQWYECPAPQHVSDASAWKKHVIIENQTELDNVCIASHDIDNDGKVDFALGAGWTKVGTIQWISRGDDEHGLWKVHQIAVEPWTHRMRFADVLGTGKPQLVVSPLNATQGNGVRLTAYSIPKHPKTDRWQPTVIDDELNRMHNHWHVDNYGNGVPDTLTASQEGIYLFHPKDGGFTKQLIHKGIEGDKPTDSGAGEVKAGNLTSDKFANPQPFIATIEPMHGTHVVVYTDYLADSAQGHIHRIVLDDTFKQGHAIFTADMNGNGRDEVIAAHREPSETQGPGVYLYYATDNIGRSWGRIPVDVKGLNGGMACEDLICTDINKDGKPDIIACGRKTKNVKLYLNKTSKNQ